MFNDDFVNAVDTVRNTRSAVSVLSNAAKILRNEYIEKKYNFTGSIQSGCEDHAVSPLLRSFLHMLINGSDIEDSQPKEETCHIVNSIGQQIIYNSVKQRYKKKLKL